jgi:hypothetical protein
MTRELFMGVVAAVLMAGVGWPQGAEEPPQLDSQTAEVLRAAGEYLQGLQSFHCECTGTHKSTGREKGTEFVAEYSITLQRPNRAAVLLKRGHSGAIIVSDGRRVHTLVPLMKKYTEQEAPQDLGELYQTETATYLNQPGGTFILSLLAADPAKTLLEGVTAGTYLGEEEIEGVKCHRLRFFQNTMDWDVWIEMGDRPLIHKITQDMTKFVAQNAPAGAPPNEQVEITLALSGWKANVEVAAEAFQFPTPMHTPPLRPQKIGRSSSETFQFQPPIHTRLVDSLLPRAKRPPATEVEGATLSWSVPGSWMAVAGGEMAVVLDARGEGIALDALGKKQQEWKIAGQAGVLRIANLSGDKGPALLASSLGEPTVVAYAPTGQRLWSYRCGPGSDVRPIDLDGDKLDEVVIGSNPGSGLSVLDRQGKLLWKAEIGNIWRVSAGDVLGDDQPEVVATATAGRVCVFDHNGTKLKEIDPGFYATWVRVAQPPRGEKAPLIVGGTEPQGEGMLVELRAGDDSRWSWWLSLDAQIEWLELARSRPWIAVAQRGGEVLVARLGDGKVIARIPAKGYLTQVGWLDRPGESPLLLVATGRDLNALTVQEPQ